MQNSNRLHIVCRALFVYAYEGAFDGRKRGAFQLSRDQLRRMLGAKRLGSKMMRELNEVAFVVGLIIIDLDDCFACVETRDLRALRQPGDRLLLQSLKRASEDLESEDLELDEDDSEIEDDDSDEDPDESDDLEDEEQGVRFNF